MFYPSFLKPNDMIGICAPSAGVGRKLESFEASLAVLKEQGYQIQETASVRVDGKRSADAKTRAEELVSCFQNPDIDFVMCAAGGDFLNEVLPYVNWRLIQKHPKFFCGASDPTGILFPLTTKYDIATIYGMNAGSFDVGTDFSFVKDHLNLIRGKHVVQHSSTLCQRKPGWEIEELVLDEPSTWDANVKSLNVKGRAIGGCMDVLKDLIGTPYEDVRGFIRRYSEDGFIWFLDNFSMSAENFYRTLCQMKYAGWFQHTKAVVIGRVLLPSSETGMSYEEAISLALGDLPVFYQADVGHTSPCMTLLFGSMASLKWKNEEASLSFHLV